MIDNLNKILPILQFQPGYFFEIIIYKNDNLNQPYEKNNNLIKHYIINNLNELFFYYDEMKRLANIFNGTVYIKLGSYSKEQLGYKMVETLSNKFQNKDLDYSDIFLTSIENMKPTLNFYVINLYFNNLSLTSLFKLRKIFKDIFPGNETILPELETKSGMQIITKPFNIDKLKIHQEEYYKCTIKKDNVVVLYCNNKNISL
jgi:hypothetical protein